MLASMERGSSVIYVAESIRELPPDVQEWLGRKDLRPLASPDVYHMLALLSEGQRFAAILVSIDSVDWNELEFFDHATRLSRGTRIYVTGRPQQHAKLEAACKHGAELFDVQLLEEDLAPPVVTLAGSQQAAAEPPARPAEVPAQSGAAPRPEASPRPASPPAAPKTSSDPSVSADRLVPKPRRIFPETLDSADHGGIAPPTASAPASSPRVMPTGRYAERAWSSKPVDRTPTDRFSDLRDPGRLDEPRAAGGVLSEEAQRETGGHQAHLGPPKLEEDNSPAVIPFPWAPSPDRPRRTPPNQVGLQGGGPEGDGSERGDDQLRSHGAPDVDEGGLVSADADAGVRLTAEEIAALLGESAETDSSARESRT